MHRLVGQLPEDLELIRLVQRFTPLLACPSSSAPCKVIVVKQFSSVPMFPVRLNDRTRGAALHMQLLSHRDDSPTIGDVWRVSNISWSLPLSLLLRCFITPLLARLRSTILTSILSLYLAVIHNFFLIPNPFPSCVCALICFTLYSIYCYRSSDVTSCSEIFF